MSEEILKIVSQFNRRDWELQTALRLAPLITGTKMSALITVPKQFDHELQNVFDGTLISFYVLYQSSKSVTCLLFRRRQLEHMMREEKTVFMLEQFGYRNMSFDCMLCELASRYQRCMERSGDFPHEIGLFLGYPTEDVSGFIFNKGKNFLYSGYWKVYSNPAGAIKLFERYDMAASQVIRHVSQGISLTNLIKYYEENQEESA